MTQSHEGTSSPSSTVGVATSSRVPPRKALKTRRRMYISEQPSNRAWFAGASMDGKVMRKNQGWKKISRAVCLDSYQTTPQTPARARRRRAEGRMFVTYPQSGNGQRQVMSDHRRNMFLSFHLVVVSRDPRVRVSLSLSQAIGSRNNMLLRSDGCFPSPALPPRRKGHDMRCARPWACKMISCSIAELLAL